MKDSVVRGCLLQLLYERRSEGSIPFGQGEQALPPPRGINHRDWLRAVAQLSEYGLIDWTLGESGIRKTINGESFGKYAQTVLTDEVNYRVLRVLRTRKNRKITS